MSIRILSAGELFPPSSAGDRVDAEDGFRGLDERFIALPARQRSRREGQSKSPRPCLPRSGLLIDPPSLRPFLQFPATRAPGASVAIEAASIAAQVQVNFPAVEDEQHI